jgi:hypothetical protein
VNEPVRILLGERASEALTAAGADAFVVIGRATYPGDPTRWAIHLLPVPMNLACDAIAVATGEVKASRPRVKTLPNPEKLAHVDPESNQTPSTP